jgi:hypothetical protein
MLILPPGHGQSIASPRRLQRRERWFVGSAALVVAILAIAVVVSFATGGSRAGKGCIDVTVASSLGGQPVTGCGAKARAICSAVDTPAGYSGNAGALIAERCRALHLAVGR